MSRIDFVCQNIRERKPQNYHISSITLEKIVAPFSLNKYKLQLLIHQGGPTKPYANLQISSQSLYSLIGDFYLIRRLIKDFKSDIVFSAGFDYDIDTYYIYIDRYIFHAHICRKFITDVPHVHNIASQTIGKVYFETYQSLRLTNTVTAVKNKHSMIFHIIQIIKRIVQSYLFTPVDNFNVRKAQRHNVAKQKKLRAYVPLFIISNYIQ